MKGEPRVDIEELEGILTYSRLQVGTTSREREVKASVPLAETGKLIETASVVVFAFCGGPTGVCPS